MYETIILALLFQNKNKVELVLICIFTLYLKYFDEIHCKRSQISYSTILRKIAKRCKTDSGMKPDTNPCQCEADARIFSVAFKWHLERLEEYTIIHIFESIRVRGLNFHHNIEAC